jgi:PTS system nitrogen regulatory IIA component
MELTARDVARLLNVSENTVYRWAREGSLPFHRLHDQYRFNRVELQEWAVVHRHRVSTDLFAPEGADDESPVGSPRLGAALERGGIHYHLPGERREEVLQAVSRLTGIPAGVDRALLHQLLVGRESLASTGIGDGIAIPHPRDPLVLRLDEPIVLLCFLAKPVDFGALDGQPVRTLFVLLSPSVRAHLRLLSLLAFALHDPALRALLEKTAPPERILGRLRAIEEAPRQPPASAAKR